MSLSTRQARSGSFSSQEPASPRARADSVPDCDDQLFENDAKHAYGPVVSVIRHVPNDLDDYADSPAVGDSGDASFAALADAHERLEASAWSLVEEVTLGLPRPGDPADTDMYKRVADAVNAFRALLALGEPFADALAAFKEEAGAAFTELNPDQLGKAQDGIERLGYFAADARRQVLARVLASAVMDMRPAQLRRSALDRERAAQPAPAGNAGKAKHAVLDAWRKTKRAMEAFNVAHGGTNRLARQTDEARAKTRADVEKILSSTVDVARKGGPGLDAIIALKITSLTLVARRADAEPLEQDEFLVYVEDFLVAQETAVLVEFAEALMDTARSRTQANDKLNALGVSLSQILASRPGGATAARDLRNTPLSGRILNGPQLRRERFAEAMRSLADGSVRTHVRGKQFVQATFMGLHRLDAKDEEITMGLHEPVNDDVDARYAKLVRSALQPLDASQLLEIRKNIRHVYNPLPIGRVTLVDALVAEALRKLGVTAADDEEGNAEPPSARENLRHVAALLLNTLWKPKLPDEHADRALMLDFFATAMHDVNGLLDEGHTFQGAVEIFKSAVDERYAAITDVHQLKRLAKGLKRLDDLPQPAVGGIMQRYLIDCVRVLDAGPRHRRMLDAQREAAPSPTGVTEGLKAAGLGTWRKTKTLGRTADAAVKQRKLERIHAERQTLRGSIDRAMDIVLRAADPMGLTRDTDLRIALAQLSRTPGFSGEAADSTLAPQALDFAEDFMLALPQRDLEQFAAVLLETAATRLQPDLVLDRLATSLAEVLEVRRAPRDLADRLREPAAVSGPQRPESVQAYRMARTLALLDTIADADPRSNPDAASALRGAIEGIAEIFPAVGEVHGETTPEARLIFEGAAASLTPEQLDRLGANLNWELLNLKNAHTGVVEQLLQAAATRRLERE